MTGWLCRGWSKEICGENKLDSSKKSKNRRRILVTNWGYQIQYLTRRDLLEIAALVVFVLMLFALLTLQVTRQQVYHKPWSDQLMGYWALMLILLMLFLVYRSILRSHQIAGPFVRIRRDYEQMKRGDLSADVRLRKGDRLEQFASDYRAMKDGLRDILEQDRMKKQTALEALEKLNSQLEKQQVPQDVAKTIRQQVEAARMAVEDIGSELVLRPQEKSPRQE
jgi:methyl-accepting chemotaxis protein